jgi:L-lactate dehydrogenase complex protein LldG
VSKAYIGVTSAEWCVASTATLAARNHPGMPRSVSLVPSIHVAVIRAGQVVADFHELYALLNTELDREGRGLTDAMTFITGPSKTADIEATLVHGAHGPRELYLIVIGG